jgi:hypothetical protein
MTKGPHLLHTSGDSLREYVVRMVVARNSEFSVDGGPVQVGKKVGQVSRGGIEGGWWWWWWW